MPNQGPSRRSFLGALTAGLLTVLGLLLAVPGVAYLLSPLWKKRNGDAPGSDFVDAGPVADLPTGTWHLVGLEVRRRDGWETTRKRLSVWVRRSGADEIAVLSPICPHLGCSVLWQTDGNQFTCPCHKGTFDAEGQLTGGPPPRGMDRLDGEVRGGRLWVRWQDFKIGTPERRSVEA
jgi:menaquinol-cytochrome c reductase iron-sulfur subunit